MPESALTPMSEPTSIKPPEFTPIVFKERYELREVLGQGGMGRVYRGFDRVLGRLVAVKVLTDVESAPMIQRFEREAQILSQMNHPNLAAVYDFGVEGAQPFMVMEFIEGKDLASLIREKGRIEPEAALHLIAQIGDGLGVAHERGVVHRDIKPENVLITLLNGKEWVEIVDFGLAISGSQVRARDRLTSPGYVVGTERYMAPEILEGQAATTASDIYAFGLVCAEMLGGTESVRGGRLRSSLYLPPYLARYWSVIERACRDEPGERWGTIREMLDAFRQAAPSSMSEQKKLPTAIRRHKFSKGRLRQRWMLALSILSVVLTWGMAINMFWRGIAREAGFQTVVLIERIDLKWKSADELQVTVAAEVRRCRHSRLLLEVAVVDAEGNRIPVSDSPLVDRSLGALQAVDIVKSPEKFEKTSRLRVPSAVSSGCVKATVFGPDNRLIVQRSSPPLPLRKSPP